MLRLQEDLVPYDILHDTGSTEKDNLEINLLAPGYKPILLQLRK